MMVIDALNANLKRCPIPTATLSGQCVGAGCMAWRWVKVANPTWTRPPAGEVPLQPMYTESTTHGFCGLAGPI